MLIFSRLYTTLSAIFEKEWLVGYVWGVTRKKSNCLPATNVFVVEKLEENKLCMDFNAFAKKFMMQ